MFSFKTFVQAYVTNITVEGPVSMDSIKTLKVSNKESNLLLLLAQVLVADRIKRPKLVKMTET